MSEGLDQNKSDDTSEFNHAEDPDEQDAVKLTLKQRIKTSKMRKKEKLKKIEVFILFVKI